MSRIIRRFAATMGAGLLATVPLISVVGTGPANAKPGTEAVAICHYDADGDGVEDPTVSEWELLLVKPKAVAAHLDHGDGYPGEAVPDTDGTYVFDEFCVPQLVTPAETIFAVAYSDVDTTDGNYDPTEDVLIAKLVDGNDNGYLDSGDKVITFKYPIAHTISDWTTDFRSFGVTEHTITNTEVVAGSFVNVYYWEYTYDANGTVIAMSQVSFNWQEKAEYESYSEHKGFGYSGLRDGYAAYNEEIDVSPSSPSAPETRTVLYSPVGVSTGENAFFDVDLYNTGTS